MTVRGLDDITYELHAQQLLSTGGTTALIHVISTDSIFTANVGDCKGVLSVRGAPDALNTCHNPPVLEERRRFEAAGVPVSCNNEHLAAKLCLSHLSGNLYGDESWTVFRTVYYAAFLLIHPSDHEPF